MRVILDKTSLKNSGSSRWFGMLSLTLDVISRMHVTLNTVLSSHKPTSHTMAPHRTTTVPLISYCRSFSAVCSARNSKAGNIGTKAFHREHSLWTATFWIPSTWNFQEKFFLCRAKWQTSKIWSFQHADCGVESPLLAHPLRLSACVHSLSQLIWFAMSLPQKV